MLPKATGNAKLFDKKKHLCQRINKIESINPHTREPILDMPSSTEAFAVVMYENCRKKWQHWHEWKQIPDNNNYEPEICQKRPEGTAPDPPENRKFVCVEEDSDFGTEYSLPHVGQEQHGGWSEQGLKEFERLLKANKQARAKKVGRDKEKEFVLVIKNANGLTANCWEEEEANKKKRKHGAVVLPVEELHEDLFDEVSIADEDSVTDDTEMFKSEKFSLVKH